MLSITTETREDYPMMCIPGGEIALRDDRIKKQWRVELSPFLLGRYPVTTELYLGTMKESPSSSAADREPVVNVSWYDAISFCNLL